MKLLLLPLIILLSLLTACSQGGSDAAVEGGGDEQHIAVIPKGTTHVFWKSVHAGARKAEQELKEAGHAVKISWKGPLKEDQRESQINVVENFLGRADAIVLAPLDSKALVAPVRQAMGQNIPVVIIDSGLDHDGIVSFCATDNVRGGELAGEHLAKLLGGKGKVILLRYALGSASTENREKGFLQAIAKHSGIEVVSSNQYAGADRNSALNAATTLLKRFPDVDGVFASNESATNGMLMALRQLSLAGGKVKFVGFDGGEANLKGLEAGDIHGLVIQDPLNMGYLGVMQAFNKLNGKPVEKRVDTGATLVTADKLSEPKIQELVSPDLDKWLK